jgi:hypothetical protein
MRLLSELSATTPTPEIPVEYLDPSSVQAPRLKAASIILLLTQKAASSKAAALAAEAAILGTKLPGFLRSAVTVLRERQVDIDFVDQFLLSLNDNLAAASSELVGIVLDALDGSVRKRQSQLDYPAVWSELKLPAI